MLFVGFPKCEALVFGHFKFFVEGVENELWNVLWNVPVFKSLETMTMIHPIENASA